MVVIYHLLQEVLSFYHASFLHLGEKIVGIELKQTIEWDTLTVLPQHWAMHPWIRAKSYTVARWIYKISFFLINNIRLCPPQLCYYWFSNASIDLLKTFHSLPVFFFTWREVHVFNEFFFLFSVSEAKLPEYPQKTEALHVHLQVTCRYNAKFYL